MASNSYFGFESFSFRRTQDQDYLGNPNNLRYPNDPNGTGIAAGGTFTVQGSGKNQYHFTRTEPPNPAVKFLIVNTAATPLPPLGYKIFLDCQCYSARDYSEMFNHGCFIGSTDLADAIPGPVVEFVKTLINGGGANDIINDFHSSTNQLYDYEQKNF